MVKRSEQTAAESQHFVACVWFPLFSRLCLFPPACCGCHQLMNWSLVDVDEIAPCRVSGIRLTCRIAGGKGVWGTSDVANRSSLLLTRLFFGIPDAEYFLSQFQWTDGFHWTTQIP
jgi:hypothetical protein